MSKINRRTFLYGAGSSLALPLLGSLVPARASLVSTVPPRLIYINWGHGGVNMDIDAGEFFPSQNLQWEGRPLINGANYRQASLPNLSGSQQISEHFSAAYNQFIPKMNFIRGLDFLQYFGHIQHPFGAVTLGLNYDAPEAENQPATPTIDQFIGASSSFYPTNYGGRRVLPISPLGSYTKSCSATVDSNGDLSMVSGVGNPLAVYNALFQGIDTGNLGNQGFTSILNNVVATYQSIKSSSKLSRADALLLEQHVQGLADIERQLAATNVCSGTSTPTSSDYNGLSPASEEVDGKALAALFNRIVVAGLQCDATRIVTMNVNDIAPTFPLNNRHHELWHKWTEVDAQNYIKQAVRYYFDAVLLDLLQRLDSTLDSDGKSMLDNTLIVVGSENVVPHDNRGMSYVTFGSAGNRFHTGRYLDYRDSYVAHSSTRAGHASFAGIPMQPFYNSILQAFGVSSGEYEKPRTGVFEHGGYGAQYVSGDWSGGSSETTDAGGRTHRRYKKTEIMSHWKSSGIINLCTQTLPGFYI